MIEYDPEAVARFVPQIAEFMEIWKYENIAIISSNFIIIFRPKHMYTCYGFDVDIILKYFAKSM